MTGGAPQRRTPEPEAEAFRADVAAGLSRPQKSLPCKYLYDDAGSQLFARICELPEYYPTRTETALLTARADEVAACVGPRARLVEFGSGEGVKVRLLLAALDAPTAYVPVDIASGCLAASAKALSRDFPHLRVQPLCADYTRPFALPPAPPGTAATAGFFPGSTIGNFDPEAAVAFLSRIARLLGPGAAMIVGVDLPKDRATLEAAYDDAAGVTAAFNANLLARINRELGGDFDVAAFAHRALWNAGDSRVEMHLVSRTDQTVRIGGHRFAFRAGESIHTENSYKYSPEAFAALARRAGFRPRTFWTDPDALFSIHALIVA